MALLSTRSQFEPASSWNGRLRNGEFFPSPFLDMASLAMPTDHKNALEWCQFIFLSNGTLKMAIERIVAYFLTDVEIGAADADDQLGDDEKEKWSNFLESIGYLSFVKQMNIDKECYGNAFGSILIPFTRFLTCGNKGCRFTVTLREVMDNPQYKFKFDNMRFMATCPHCAYQGQWDVEDRKDGRPEKIILKRWSPHEIYIIYDEFSGHNRYYWKIPESYKADVRKGKPLVLERVSKEVLEAIKKNCNLFEFDDDVIYHMFEPPLSGIQHKGWGISRIITHFRQCWYVQVLHRYNESIALDYVIPFRVVTPREARHGDPMIHTNMGDFMGQVRSMIGRRKKDPAGWHTLPFPIEYQALGGEANSLTPSELLNQGLETLLNSIGTPVELYKGTLQLQTAPAALRLFEATWHHLAQQNNQLLKWFVRKVCELLSWEAVDARHKRVTHADDIQRQMAVLQLMMSNMVSKTTALKTLGLDNRDEQRTMAEEVREEQRIQAEIQEEMDTAAFGQQISKGMPPGGGPPGMPMDPAMMGGGMGMPPGGGMGMSPGMAGGSMSIDPMTGQPVPGPVTGMIMSGNVPQTPEEMLQQADVLADQLLGMPEGQKDSELRALKNKNEVLHSLVKAKLEQKRSQAKQQGGSMLLSQQYGTTPPMA